jgi:hypothetical protein
MGGNSYKERLARLIAARDRAEGIAERRSLQATINRLRLSRP